MTPATLYRPTRSGLSQVGSVEMPYAAVSTEPEAQKTAATLPDGAWLLWLGKGGGVLGAVRVTRHSWMASLYLMAEACQHSHIMAAGVPAGLSADNYRQALWTGAYSVRLRYIGYVERPKRPGSSGHRRGDGRAQTPPVLPSPAGGHAPFPHLR